MLSSEDIENLQNLCRIKCTATELEEFFDGIQKVLSYVEQLQEVDTAGIVPCNHVLSIIANVTRKDEVGGLLSRDAFLKNAPDQVAGMIRVPPVIKE